MSKFRCLNRNIPDLAHEQLLELGPSTVQELAFSPTGGWVLVSKGGHVARNIPNECYERLEEFVGDGDTVRSIAFTPTGGWVIITDQRYFARGIPDQCFEMLVQMWNDGDRPTCIAFTGPTGCLILAGSSVRCENVDDELASRLQNAAQGPCPVERVIFSADGRGWVTLAADGYFARNIDDACFQEMCKFTSSLDVITHMGFTSTGGFSIVASHVEQAPFDPPAWPWPPGLLEERMTANRVIGVSIAAVHDNRVAWKLTCGSAEAGSGEPVSEDTVFQACSLSKPVTALGALRLVQDGLIGLDDPVPPLLGWELPLGKDGKDEWMTGVTLRRILAHTSGICGLGGFGGYSADVEHVPNTVEILNGQSERPGVLVNSGKAVVTYEPGSSLHYSGLAITVAQRLLENLRSTEFSTWMADNILTPLGMMQSTYSLQPVPTSGAPASGHDRFGRIIPGKRNKYAASAAAGLYSTPSDLCRFIIAVNSAGGAEIKSTLYHEMRDHSLGIFVSNLGTADEVFEHGGVNEGFRCVLKGCPPKRNGFVIMSNGDSGDVLNGELCSAFNKAGWDHIC